MFELWPVLLGHGHAAIAVAVLNPLDTSRFHADGQREGTIREIKSFPACRLRSID